MFFISARVAGTWKIRSTLRFVTYDLYCKIQRCLFTYFLLWDSTSWSFVITEQKTFGGSLESIYLNIKTILLMRKLSSETFIFRLFFVFFLKIWHSQRQKTQHRDWKSSFLNQRVIQADRISVTIFFFGPSTNLKQYFVYLFTLISN